MSSILVSLLLLLASTGTLAATWTCTGEHMDAVITVTVERDGATGRAARLGAEYGNIQLVGGLGEDFDNPNPRSKFLTMVEDMLPERASEFGMPFALGDEVLMVLLAPSHAAQNISEAEGYVILGFVDGVPTAVGALWSGMGDGVNDETLLWMRPVSFACAVAP